MVRNIATISVLALFAASHAEARPVSYQGGWTVIEQTDRQSTALWVHYTVNPHLSLGWRTEWDRREDFVYNGPKATVLAKRWFGENYQANIYGVASAGVVTGVGDNPLETSAAGFVGAMADWETRSLFVSYSARVMEGENIDSMFMQAGRVGFAPYVGDTGDLHTWLMVEVDHRPGNDEKIGVTPLVRFFKGGALFEAGWSVMDNQPLINFTYRF
jgi:hypothetical protein